MFERFTEAARQSLFCARYKTEERNGDQIDMQDLLGGLMMAAPNGILRFASQDAEILRPVETLEQWSTRQRDELMAGTGTARMGRELPFSSDVILALKRAVQEADDLGHKSIRSEHLLLGLLLRRTLTHGGPFRRWASRCGRFDACWAGSPSDSKRGWDLGSYNFRAPSAIGKSSLAADPALSRNPAICWRNARIWFQLGSPWDANPFP
jgi:hypothetical protein